MARSTEGRRRRKAKLKARVASENDDHLLKCSIIGCGRPTARAERKGLDAFLCRQHRQFKQRNGSPFCPSPAATVLKPYWKAALSFIDVHRTDPFINAALVGLADLMQSAGQPDIPTRLKSMPPADRARMALARLRAADVKPERLLAITVAVHALIEEAPAVCHRIKDWRIVAIAKAAHRLASGYHRTWETQDVQGRPRRIELHAYPRSSGRVLRHLGEMIEEHCGLVIEHFLTDIVAIKVKRYGQHLSVADPAKFAATLANASGTQKVF